MSITLKLKKIVATILTIFLFLSIISIMVLTATKKIISRNSIAQYIETSDILNLQVGKLFKVSDLGITANSSIKDTVILLAQKEEIPDVIINDIVESSELNNLMSDFLRGIIDYAVIGDEKPTISYEAMKKLMAFSNTSLDNHINLIIEKEQLEMRIEKYVLALNKLVPDRNEIVIDSDKVDIFRQVLTFNPIYLYLFSVIILAIIGLLLWSWYLPIKQMGITLTLSGIIFTIIGSLEWPIYNLIKLKINDIDNLLKPLLKHILLIFFKEGVFCTVVGIFLIIIFIVINRFSKNKKNIQFK